MLFRSCILSQLALTSGLMTPQLPTRAVGVSASTAVSSSGALSRRAAVGAGALAAAGLFSNVVNAYDSVPTVEPDL